MDFYNVLSIILPLAVLIGYINHRFIKMQTTIAIMFASLIISLGLIVLGQLGFKSTHEHVSELLASLNFHELLMDGMLSFLLFAGALTVDFNSLRSQKWEITALAFVGTIVSTFVLATLTYFLTQSFGVGLPFVFCLLFGALISPTDPIAVLAMCKEVNAPKKLTATIAGESLFNDGVGIVIFLTLFQVAFSGETATWQGVTILFLREAVGGVLYGMALGLLGYWLIKPVDDHKIEILITIAMVTGGYALAQAIHVSGPLAMVVAGIFIGNKGRMFSMTKSSRDALDNFWELIDEILNAMLFLLIGLELLIIPITRTTLLIGLITIPMVLVIRFIIVGTPFAIFKRWKTYHPHTIKILTWGGLRGGLAVALALALPDSDYRDVVLTMTYAVVVFAIIVQGMTVKPLVKLAKEL